MGNHAEIIQHAGRPQRAPVEPVYASGDFQDLLEEHGIEGSMSGTDNSYDNAVVENSFALLKRDRVNRG